jgi:hypothetical protein
VKNPSPGRRSGLIVYPVLRAACLYILGKNGMLGALWDDVFDGKAQPRRAVYIQREWPTEITMPTAKNSFENDHEGYTKRLNPHPVRAER